MTVPRCLRLWRSGRKTSTTKSSTSQTLALRLSHNVWLLVLDHLAPHDLLHLSHTCKALRSVAAHQFPEEVRCLSPPVARTEFVKAFALTSLDHWACIVCSRLHRIDFTDIPTNYHSIECPHSNPSETGSYWATDLVTPGSYYVTRLRHVQLALKYADRRGLDPAYERYLKDLMAPYHREGDQKLRPMRWNDVTPHLQYRAQPKIVTLGLDGGSGSISQYLLREEWRYSLIDENSWTWDCIERNALQSLKTCCHVDCDWLCFCPRPSMATRSYPTVTLLGRNIEKLFYQRLNNPVIFSCGYCPTDFELCLEDEDFKGRFVLVIRVWKDMRTSKEEWTRRTDYVGKLDLSRMTDYTPGDTRYMYEHGSGRPMHAKSGAREPKTSCWWRRKIFTFGSSARAPGSDKKQRGIDWRPVNTRQTRPDAYRSPLTTDHLGLLLF